MAGLGRNQRLDDAWATIMDVSNEEIRHRLWVLVVREVAAATLEAEAEISGLSEEEELDRQTALINKWFYNAMPDDDELTDIVGEFDYFLYHVDRAWDEYMNFSGEACGYCSEVVYGLRELYPPPASADNITEEMVESFYTTWRAQFLSTVASAAESLEPENWRL